jgi:hypothetical protein
VFGQLLNNLIGSISLFKLYEKALASEFQMHTTRFGVDVRLLKKANKVNNDIMLFVVKLCPRHSEYTSFQGCAKHRTVCVLRFCDGKNPGKFSARENFPNQTCRMWEPRGIHHHVLSFHTF